MLLSFIALAQQCAPTVAPSTLRAVLAAESGGMPHAIGRSIRHRSGQSFRLGRQPSGTAEAIGWATWLLANGYAFDAGVGQVNSSNWPRLGLNASNVFDACTNIRAAAYILTESYNRAIRRYGPGQQALRAAVSAYNTGSFSAGYRNGYVNHVAAAAAFPPVIPIIGP